jgi:hypothetical protein
MPTIIDLDDLDNYDLEDGIIDLDIPLPNNSTSHLLNISTSHLSNISTSGLSGVSTGRGWVCEQCTLHNPALFLACSVCQHSRVIDSAEENFIDLTGEVGSSWDCGLCTFRNENVMDGKCGVCGTEMP